MAVRKLRIVFTCSEAMKAAIDAACEGVNMSESSLSRIAVADFIGYELTKDGADPIKAGKKRVYGQTSEMMALARRNRRSAKDTEIDAALATLRAQARQEAGIG